MSAQQFIFDGFQRGYHDPAAIIILLGLIVLGMLTLVLQTHLR